MTPPVRVAVVLPDGSEVVAGALHFNVRGQHETAVFQYDTGYLAHPYSYSLGPDLPLTAGTHVATSDRNLFGAMADSAPDRWGKNLLRRAERAAAREEQRTPRTLLGSDFLLGTHDRLRQGALRFQRDGDVYLGPDDAGVPRLVDIPQLLALTDRAIDDPDLDSELRDLVNAGGSLGGARPKAAVRDRRGRLMIAKFPRKGSDEWDTMAWEAVTLDLAADAGIDVPRHEIVSVGDRSVLLLERFDREGERRVGYISAMTLVGASERTDGFTMAELAQEAMDQSAQPTRDGAALLRRSIFSALVSNTDNHLRNHGFLRRATGWALSPAFDLNPDPEGGPPAMSIGDAGTMLDALTESDWFGIARRDAMTMLAEVNAAVDGWRGRAEAAGLDQREISLMKRAFEGPARQEVAALRLS